VNEGPLDDPSEAYDEDRLLSLNGPIDENEYTVLLLNEPTEPIELKQHVEPIESKEPVENENLELMEPTKEPMESVELNEPIELKRRIEENAEAYDECTLIDDLIEKEE
jgi:hypothetical protein